MNFVKCLGEIFCRQLLANTSRKALLVVFFLFADLKGIQPKFNLCGAAMINYEEEMLSQCVIRRKLHRQVAAIFSVMIFCLPRRLKGFFKTYSKRLGRYLQDDLENY